MSEPSYGAQAASIVAQVELSPEFARLRDVRPDLDLSPDLIAAVVDEAARFAQGVIAPLNADMDRNGARVVDGRVVLTPGQTEAWKAFADAGWMSLDVSSGHGGQGLPLTVLGATQELFDRAAVAFGMLSGGSRSAARLIESHGDAAMQAEWLPRIATGERSATICISEPGAGSDVGRIRTRAVADATGGWRVTGEKIWISFGDHQATERIGHCLLARTNDQPGTRGLSLFLAPSVIDTAAGPVRNGVHTRRVEEKMGLHGSPTCALGFEEAHATLIGPEGRGLSLLFRMIVAMRLSVGVQGLGIASGASAVAHAYALERRQGGSPKADPVPIAEHWDVRRMLAEMTARIETLRGLCIAAAATADLADHEPEAARRVEAAALLEWLLPIVKTSGADTAFEVSSQAVQVLGGAGYTQDWPVEQRLRDARVLAIYEGTSGIQAQDLLKRRLLADDAGYRAFMAAARAAGEGKDPTAAGLFADALAVFEATAEWLRSPDRTPADHECSATEFLALAILIAHGWIALRLTGAPAPDLRTAGRCFLRTLGPKTAGLSAAVRLGQSRFD